MSDGEKRSIPHALPVFALSVIPSIVQLARERGYAIAVHGSLARDFDFVAVPWTEDACSAEELVEAVVQLTGGFVNEHDEDPFPRRKPHGRLAWSIHLGGGPYIDLSIMPRLLQ